jgi:hypothetical protein
MWKTSSSQEGNGNCYTCWSKLTLSGIRAPQNKKIIIHATHWLSSSLAILRGQGWQPSPNPGLTKWEFTGSIEHNS